MPPSSRARAWPTAIDLFSGCGGLTLGLRRARFRVLGAVELDPLAVETYRLNHPSVKVWPKDIRHVSGDEILKRLRLEVGELDLLAGCPPCQGFSSMTTLNGKWIVEDERNDLIAEYGRLVSELQPKAVLMENVPGLADDERLSALLAVLAAEGYATEDVVQVLDAQEYGVPQRRRRLVMMSAVGAVVPFAKPVPTRATVRDAIEDLLPAGSSKDPLHDFPENRSDVVKEIIAGIPKDGGSRQALGADRQLACHKRVSGFRDVYGRMAWDSPAPTITGGCHNPSKGRFIHPAEDRAITMREAALLQGFPLDYKFSLRRGKLAAAAMIGNAVPADFVAAQAEQIRRHLSSAP